MSERHSTQPQTTQCHHNKTPSRNKTITTQRHHVTTPSGTTLSRHNTITTKGHQHDNTQFLQKNIYKKIVTQRQHNQTPLFKAIFSLLLYSTPPSILHHMT